MTTIRTNLRTWDIRADEVIDCWKCVTNRKHGICVEAVIKADVWEKTRKAV